MSQFALQLVQVTARAVLSFTQAQAACTSEDFTPIVDQAVEVLHATMQRMQPPLVAVVVSAPDILKKNGHKSKVAEKLRHKAVEAEDRAYSEWDPEPIDVQIESGRCRALLLEILRRAAHDWVLYRQHDRLELKEIAERAYVWLFEEGPGHPWWKLREKEGRQITSFLAICDTVDLTPEMVRSRVRELDVKTIMGAGRPAERRKRRDTDDVHYASHDTSMDIDVNSYGDSNTRTSYENHYAVSTPSYM